MDCGFETKAESMDSLMPKISKHASEAHNIKQIPDDLRKKVSSAIKVMH